MKQLYKIGFFVIAPCETCFSFHSFSCHSVFPFSDPFPQSTIFESGMDDLARTRSTISSIHPSAPVIFPLLETLAIPPSFIRSPILQLMSRRPFPIHLSLKVWSRQGHRILVPDDWHKQTSLYTVFITTISSCRRVVPLVITEMEGGSTVWFLTTEGR